SLFGDSFFLIYCRFLGCRCVRIVHIVVRRVVAQVKRFRQLSTKQSHGERKQRHQVDCLQKAHWPLIFAFSPQVARLPQPFPAVSTEPRSPSMAISFLYAPACCSVPLSALACVHNSGCELGHVLLPAVHGEVLEISSLQQLAHTLRKPNAQKAPQLSCFQSLAHTSQKPGWVWVFISQLVTRH